MEEVYLLFGMKNLQIKTQLGGKFSRSEPGLFVLKRKLERAGIGVEYPKSNKIVTNISGIDLTFDPKKEGTSFFEVEIDFFRAIKENNIHIVHNKFIEKIGYIGESASIELAYALSHNKPVILLYKPVFSNSVPQKLIRIINSNLNKISILRLDKILDEDINEKIFEKINKRYKYNISVIDELIVYEEANRLLDKYRRFK